MRVITDASNWTTSALGSHKYAERNVESMLFLDSEALDDNRTALRYMGQWLTVLERYAYQSVERDGEPPAADVIAALSAAEDWPTVEVVFEAQTETEWGEEVYAVGDLDALGQWGQAGVGVRLATTPETYPTWRSEPVALKLGTRFEWKLVARVGDAVRWEDGDNRHGQAVLPVCGEAVVTGNWR